MDGERLRIDGAPNNEETATTPWEVHHVLGEATSVQDDVRSVGWMLHDDDDWGHKRHGPCDPARVDLDAWQVLLALHMDDRLRLELHDGGALHLLVPVADLAAGSLDRVQYVIATSGRWVRRT